MSRDYRKLKVFEQADELMLHIYAFSRDFPVSERFGLQAQMRRAALSVAANIVEGSARLSTGEFVNFLNISVGSAAEVRYLAGVAGRLGLASEVESLRLAGAYSELCGRLHTLIRTLDARR